MPTANLTAIAPTSQEGLPSSFEQRLSVVVFDLDPVRSSIKTRYGSISVLHLRQMDKSSAELMVGLILQKTRLTYTLCEEFFADFFERCNSKFGGLASSSSSLLNSLAPQSAYFRVSASTAWLRSYLLRFKVSENCLTILTHLMVDQSQKRRAKHADKSSDTMDVYRSEEAWLDLACIFRLSMTSAKTKSSFSMPSVITSWTRLLTEVLTCPYPLAREFACKFIAYFHASPEMVNYSKNVEALIFARTLITRLIASFDKLADVTALDFANITTGIAYILRALPHFGLFNHFFDNE